MHLQKQKQREFLTLKPENISVMQYANKFAKLSWFTPEYVATDRMRMLRFEEGLAFYIRNQLAGQPVQSSQELYERAAEIERVKKELRIVGQANSKKRWYDRGTLVEGASNKKPALPRPKPQNSMARKHCSKCGRTNHDTTECRMGTNQCFWCGDSNHLIADCATRLFSQQKGPSSIPKVLKLQPQ